MARKARLPVPRWGWSFLRGLAIVAAVLLAYWPVLHAGGFIWDDPQYILRNYTLRTSAGLAAIWIHPLSIPQYYPAVHTLFWIEYHLWQLNPTGYHIVNILLHSTSALLLWRILKLLQIPGAYLAAIIFAVHPVHVESVAWITERKNVLSLLFYLLALRAALPMWGLDHGPDDAAGASASAGRFARRYALVMALFMLALLSKSVTCSLPAAMVLLIYWKRGRVTLREIALLAPMFVVGAGMAMVTGYLERTHVGASGPNWNFTVYQRWLIAGRAVWFYAGKLALPIRLIFIYPRWDVRSPGQWWLAGYPIAASAVIVLLFVLRRRIGRGPIVAVLFFVGTLLPALGFINLYPMLFSFVADHFQYHASIGLIVLASAGISITLRRYRAALIGTGVAIVAVLMVLTYLQGFEYHDEMSLWTTTLARNNTVWMAYANRGDLYAQAANVRGVPAAGREEYLRLAKADFARMISLAPDQSITCWKWGMVLERDGNKPEAETYYRRAIELDGRNALAMNSLGMLLAGENRVAESIGWFKQCLVLDPGNADAAASLGNALERQGDLLGSLEAYSRAAEIRAHAPR